MGKLVCTNSHIKIQCLSMLNSIAIFENGLVMASRSDVGRTDPNESIIIQDIGKDLNL